MSKEHQVLFLGGFPSGGTDLSKNIINAHSDISINGEMPFLYRLQKFGISSDFKIRNQRDIDQLKESLAKADVYHNLENLDGVSMGSFKDGEASLSEFFRIAFGKQEYRVWGNKTPQNTENIAELQKYFPDAKFLIITRDIRDVALSWKKKWGKNMLLTAHKWNTRMSTIPTSKNILIVSYEDMIQELEATTKNICEFLNLNWEPGILRFNEKVEKVIDGKINYGKPVKSENKNKWKKSLNDRTIKRLEELAFDSLKLHGYEISRATNPRTITKIESYFGRLHDAYAMLMVGNRFKKDNSFSSRLKEVYRQIFLRL